jgi:hypothetical protein
MLGDSSFSVFHAHTDHFLQLWPTRRSLVMANQFLGFELVISFCNLLDVSFGGG